MFENDGAPNDIIEIIQDTLECLDLVKEFKSELDNAILNAQKEATRLKQQLREVEEIYNRVQCRNAEHVRALEERRAQIASNRANVCQQSSAQDRPYYDYYRSSYSVYYAAPHYSTSMIQTHEGCLFPVRTSVSTIRNCLINMGTFESGHGRIADCPIVDASRL